MADACARALQKRLHNDSLPWKQRLSLGKKAFLSRRLEKIENRHVILTDWITCLLNSHQISVEREKESLKLWKCLQRMLEELKRRKKVGEKASLRNGICVTRTFLHTVLKWLQHLHLCRNEKLVECVVGCTKVLVQEDALDDVFTRNVEEYIELISVLLFIVSHSECWKQETRTELKRLLNSVLKKRIRFLNYGRNDGINIFVKTSRSLLVPAISFLCSSKADTNNFEVDLHGNTRETVGTLLFQQDLKAHFVQMFDEMFSKHDGPMDCPQFFVDFLSFIQRRNVDDEIGTSYTDHGFLLLFLFQSFRDSYKNIPSSALNRFFVVLCLLLGVDLQRIRSRLPDIFTVCLLCRLLEPVSFKDSEESLLNLAVFLEGCLPCLFATADDKTLTVPFFVNLADFLLSDIKCRSISWYRCIRSLLTFNPLLFVPLKIDSLLKNVWLDASELGLETKRFQFSIVCELFNVYAKLRQIPKFVSKLLLTLCEMDSQLVRDDLRLSAGVLDRFNQICLSIYPQHAIEVWSFLQNYISQKLTSTDEIQSVENLRRVHPAIDLLKTLLKCARLADRSLPKEISLAIVEALDSTFQNCFLQLVQQSIDFADLSLLHNTLQLIHSWGELNLVLMTYNSEYAKFWCQNHGCNFDVPTSNTDLSLVHYGIRADVWEKVNDVCQNSENLELKHIFLLLVLQKLKAVNVFGDRESPVWTEQQESVTSFVLSFAPSTETFGTEGKISVESWALICNVLPMLASTMTLEDVDVIAKIIVSSSTCNLKTHKESFAESLELVTQTLLECREFHETAVFHTAIITASIEQMSTSLSVGSSEILMKTAKMLKPLYKNSKMWLQLANTVARNKEEPNEMWVAVAKASRSFTKLLGLSKKNFLSEVSTSRDVCASRFLELLNLLERFPLEHFFPGNQIRCFVQVCSILCIAAQNSNVNDDDAEVIVTALRIIVSLFDGRRRIWLFDFVRANNVLLFFVGPFMGLIKKMANCCEFKIVEEVQQLWTSLLHTLVNHTIKDQSALTDFENFLDEVRLFPSWTMELNVSSDYLTVACALTMLRSFRNVSATKVVKHCVDYSDRLLNDFCRWFAAIHQDFEVLKEQPKFVELMVLFLEAFMVVLDRKENCRQTEEESHYEIKEFRMEFIPTIVNFILTIPESCFRPKLKPTLSSFLSTVARNLHNLKPLLANDIFETVWKLSNRCITMKREESDDSELQQAIESLVVKSNTTEFHWLFQNLLSDMTIDDLTEANVPQIKTALSKWAIVVKLPLTDDKSVVMKENIGQFFVRCQHVLLQAPTRTEISAIVLDVEADIIRHLTSREHLSFILHTCSVLDLKTIESHVVFVRHFDAVYKVLNNMVVHQDRFVAIVIVAFLSAVQHLIHSVITKSEQNVLKKCLNDRVSDIHECAQKIQRLLNQMSRMECAALGKLAPYVIADFVTESSMITLYPSIKNTLTVGIYDMLSLCDAVDIPPLLASLPQSGCEVFNVLHTNYKKYYRYTGKV